MLMNRLLFLSLTIGFFCTGACKTPANQSTSSTDNGTEIINISITLDPSTSSSDITTTTGSVTSSDSNLDSDNATTEFDPDDCGQQQIQNLPFIPPNVVLVLDKSGSMVNPDLLWDHDNESTTEPVTRWFSLHQVVTTISNEFNERMNLGVVLFPSIDAIAKLSFEACLVNPTPEVPVSPRNADQILAGIPPANATNLAGGTPAEQGIQTAFNHLLDLDAQVPRFMILITDGAYNCSTSITSEDQVNQLDTNLPITVAAALAQGIPTYVVGIDILNSVDNFGINPFVALNDVAIAGGRARIDSEEKFYNVTDQAQLVTALQTIVNEVLSCTITLEQEKPPNTSTQVWIGEMVYETEISTAEACETQSGWRYVDSEGSTIQLCGRACGDYQMQGEIEVRFICASQG